MANLPENTTYNTNSTPITFGSLSNIVKSMQEKSQSNSGSVINNAIINHYNPDVANSIFNPGVAAQPTSSVNGGAFPYGTQIAPPTPTGTPPPSYERFLAPTSNNGWALPSGANQSDVQDWPSSEQGNPGDQYVTTPTDTNAVLRNWPAALGGGQYVLDQSNPDEMIKSGRVIMNDTLNPGGRSALLGGLDPKMYQIDHIVPLEFGGADTLQNLQILSTKENAEKQRIQAVPLSLLANHKITLAQAKVMALNWKSQDPTGLPSADDVTNKLGGFVPVDVAEKQAKKWQDAIDHPSTMKYFGEAFKENMANFGKGWLPDPIREFAKGLVGGGTAGIVPNTGPSEGENAGGKIGNIAGNIVGTLTGLGLLTKGIGAAITGTKALLGIGKVAEIADSAMKTAGLATDVGNLTEKAVNAKSRMQTLGNMAKSAGLLSLWGQIGLTGKEATGQTQADLKNHMTQFFSDVAYGGLLGSAGQTFKGYAKVGLGTAALSLISGDSIVPALQNAALMTSLHGMAYEKGLPNVKTNIANEEAYKMSATAINKYLGDVVPTVKKGGVVPDVLNLDLNKLDTMRTEYQQKYPNDQRFKDLGPIENNTDAINFIENASRRQFGNIIAKSDGALSQEDIKKEMTRIVTAKNQLYNQTLPLAEREQKEIQDLMSLGQKLKPSIDNNNGVKVAINANDNLKKIPLEIPNQTFENPQTEVFPTGKGGITGYGEKLDPEAKANIDDFAKNPAKYDGKIYIPKTDSETAAIQRGINNDFIANGKEAPTENPENTLRAFVRTTDGEFKPIGYIPQEKSFDIKKNNLNMTYNEQIDRFKHTIDTAKSPEELQKLFAKDKSKINIDINTAEQIFNSKGTLSDQQLYDLLKPGEIYHKLDSNLNNTNIYNKMDELGIDNLIVDPLKAWEINGERPRYNPENPYINLNISDQDWLRSMAIKDAKVPETPATPPETTTTPTEVPVASTDTPVTPTESPVTPTEAPVTPTEAPLTPVETPASKISNVISNFKPNEKAIVDNTPEVKKEPIAPVEAPRIPLKSLGIPSTEEAPRVSNKAPLGKVIAVPKGIKPDLTNQLFTRIVDNIEYTKVKPDTPKGLEEKYMNVVKSFRSKNPGISDEEFKNATEDAKSRAKFYVQDLVDDMYKGTKDFGTEDTYTRKKNEVEPEEKLGRDEKLANEFGLKLKAPNEKGIKYLALDKYGNPVFSEEYLKAHPNTKGSPLNTWGSFLGDELKVNKKLLSVKSKTWSEQIKKMKTDKNPYTKGMGEAIDKALSEKFDVKDKQTGETLYPWEGSWKLNSSLNKMKDLFTSKNDEGALISQPYRRTMASGTNKSYSEIRRDVNKADTKTKSITEKAREKRIQDFGYGDKIPDFKSKYGTDSIKDNNQIQDVSNDLTPYDILNSGLIKQEVRSDLISRYNNIVDEMKPGRRIETRIGAGDEKILGTKDEMNRLFTGIKKLSEFIPESKDWKPGKKISIKNDNPTFKEGVNDGIRFAAQIFKLNKSKGSVDFENIKKMLNDKSRSQKGSIQINATIKAGLAGLGLTGLYGLSRLGNTSTYNRKEETPKENPKVEKFLKAIASNETSVIKNDKYLSSQPSGKKELGDAMGKYRVTEGELKAYAPIYLGRSVSAEEFQNSPKLQDEYMKAKFLYLSKKGYTPQQIADIHNKGMTNSYPPGSEEYQNPNYVSKFNTVYESKS